MVTTRFSRFSLLRKAVETFFAVLLGLVTMATAAFAQGLYQLDYQASLGTLPSDQGWVHVVDDPAPIDGLDETNYSVAGGVLVHGDTGGGSGDLGNEQVYELAGYVFDFEQDAIEIDIRLRIVESTIDVTPGGQIRPGYTVYLKDHEYRNVYLVFA